MDKTAYALNLIVDLIAINDMICNEVVSDYLTSSGFNEDEINKVLALIYKPQSAYRRCTSF